MKSATSPETLTDSPLPHELSIDRLNERIIRQEGSMNYESDWSKVDRSERKARLNWYVGNTPIEGFYLGGRNDVMVKQEYKNPSGSHYDRVYLRTIQELENSGLIQPGDELRDISSGSAGISLAMIGGLLDYKVRLTVPDELPESRIKPMKYFGAEIVNAGPGYVPVAAAMQAEEILDLHEDPEWAETRPGPRNASSFIFEKDGKRICYINHSENELSVEGFKYLGMELGLDSKLTDPKPDKLLLAAGNWTTIAGIAPEIRSLWPETEIIAFEGRDTSGPHDNYGTTVNGLRLKYKNESLVDDVVQVPNRLRDYMDELINPGRDIENQLGHSSLMGLGLAKEMIDANPDTRIVTIGYAQKYRY